MILVSMWLLCTLTASAATAELSFAAAELDGLLQEYAFKAFLGRPKTGVAYDGAVSPNLTGIRVSAMRLKSGSLLKRGVSMYQEFEIPTGVATHPYVERLALLYHNLANWSLAYYPPLQGYTYLAPVLGLLAYDASQLQPTNSTRLYIRASARPISIHFSHLLLQLPAPALTKCVFFDVNGSVYLSDMLSGNICTTFQEGHFSVVVETTTITTIPLPPQHRTSKVWKIVCGVLGGFALLVVALVWARRKYKQRERKRMHSMEMVAEFSEALFMTAIGTTKAPAAIATRTHPKLETDYVP